ALPPEGAAAFVAVDVFLGDTLGEMFFYLSAADRVVVGGGFNPRGAHNISEALMLMKPVITGPWTWTIEFPFEEAALAGIAARAGKPTDTAAALSAQLVTTLSQPDRTHPARIRAFLDQQEGASARSLAAIDAELAAAAARRKV